ncbi:asparagine synthase C-terminal domain-containing protein [Pontixanthobacter aestiaquae]|uniref:asparagine synthase-related protein n=1 Tax=Pontixanthobacter aestiaquae TaxID=1509367 RepID=UPI001F225448|nr:asparagine synthase C-terminal domain-containing protein [Pontixanthobacter aestiaquae]MDN3644821.1 asparagine synthase C-terminal domain-containing protein [Pontixanthobacter aestiaquae]
MNLASDENYIEAGRELLKQAVSDRLRDIKRPAVHLSGGLDSSAVAALVTNRQRGANLPDPPSYAWYLGDPDNPSDDETRWAEAARSALDLTMHAPATSAENITALLRSDWSQGPDASNLLGEDAILGHARGQGVDGILSGWGGDEGLSFNGRGHRAQLLTSLHWRQLAAVCDGSFPMALARGVKQGFTELRQSNSGPQTKQKLAKSYLRRDIVKDVELITPPPISLRNTRQAMTSLLATGAQTARLEDWAIAGRRYGITYSYPLLDRRVMEFALSLPGHLFYRPEARRWIMRKVLDPKLPDLIRWNSSKLERARVAQLGILMAEAFRQCADLLEDCSDFAGTDQFVDVSRLIADLRGPEDTLLDNFSYKRRALQFLRF